MQHLSKTRFLCEMALIAAIYATLTLALAPISFGAVQLRVSEALSILPFFTAAAVPALFVGCLISNIFGSALGLLDIIAGSLATLCAAFIASKIKNKWLVPLPSVIINAFVVGWVLYLSLGVPFFINVLWVGIGQALACYGLGMPLLFILEKYKKAIFLRS
ncbi:MAG: QueT transporter family protein [Christensenellaceae bacterium]